MLSSLPRRCRWRLVRRRRTNMISIVPALCLLVAFISPRFAFSASREIFTRPDVPYKVSGSVSTSDGKTLSGTVYTTLGKTLSIYDRASERFVDFSLPDVARIDVSVEEEREEPVWSWKESGSDEKVFTGKSYPWRKYLTTVTTRDGRVLSGDLDGLICLEPSFPAIDSTAPALDSTASASPPKVRFLFHKRHKGEAGAGLSDLVYVKSLILTPR